MQEEPVSLEYRFRWQKNGPLMTMFNALIPVDKDESPQLNRNAALHEEGYAVCIVGSPCYYSFQVFKLQLDTEYILILSTANQGMKI